MARQHPARQWLTGQSQRGRTTLGRLAHSHYATVVHKQIGIEEFLELDDPPSAGQCEIPTDRHRALHLCIGHGGVGHAEVSDRGAQPDPVHVARDDHGGDTLFHANATE